MYLQSLEIVGFKSFAAKTVLHFHRGVTAVVGPNGCGKSNILDAIRWVLGEQSAKALRGGEMADVIFSGTDTRQPHNMAEVSLTFAECEQELGVEWHELCITRRVFRDGKSEYLMNRKPCRLKDIHELFMDTGIGRSAYSIMEQGKLDQILSSRPDDRRTIFEEAAGITKFKAQKKEALRKLEYTDSNLIRVTDIIKEVKRQIGSLQRQAGKARRYQSLMSDLRTLDTHLSHRTYQDLEKSIEQLSTSIEKSSEVRFQQENQIAEQEQECAVLRETLTSLDSETQQLRDRLQHLNNKIFSGENRVATNKERQEEFHERSTQMQSEIEAFHTRVSEQESELERTESQLTELLDLLQTEEAALSTATDRATKAQQERVDAERYADTFGQRLHSLDNRLSDLRGKVSSAIARRDTSQQRLEQLQSEKLSMEQTLLGLTTQAEAMTEAHHAAKEDIASAKEALETTQSAHQEAQSARQQAENEWNALGKQLAERESRRELLAQLEKEGEGLGEGTQAILRGLDKPDFFQAGTLGTLASLIDVPTEDIPAIEAALGAASRSVVFKDADVAQTALQTLKAAAQGRAAVLMADWPYTPEELPTLPDGALSWAASIVKASEPVRAVAGRLLEKIAIVPDLDTAFRLKQEHPTLAFATRAGEFISHEGVAHGGADGEGSPSALLRRSQIAALEQEVSTLRAEESRLETARESAATLLEQTVQRLQEARDQVNQAQMALSAAQSEELLATRELQEHQKRSEALSLEVGNLEAQAQKFEEQILQAQEQLDAVSEEISQTREERTSAQAQISTLRETETEAASALAEARLKVATERQHQQALSQQKIPLQARLRELAQSISSRQREMTMQEEKMTSLASESQELSENIITWKEELTEGEGTLAQKTEERSTQQEKVKSLETALRTVQKELTEVQDQRSKEEVRLTELRLRAESIQDHISRRYQMELSAFEPDRYALLKVVTDSKERKRTSLKAAVTPSEEATEDNNVPEDTENSTSPAEEGTLPTGPTPIEEIPWEKIETMVEELTERVDSMGPVNIEAIQEYEELEERFAFLEKQNTDLINAKTELLEVISRINKTTKELFSTTFERVRVNFQEMFKELFGGGKANLLLVDDTNPLESGIEIIARPPGKQLQSISLLSGGERTMTAVALLFAIYMVKPSPFCVLDEMDAPLDESNIGRFIKLVDRFVDQSQFFVITHNKRTMSRADMLYGVTMEERGVTKLLSVNFHGKENEKPAEIQKEAAPQDKSTKTSS